MSMTTASGRVRAFLDPRPVSWVTVVLLAIVLTYADGFVLTVLTGAVGAIQRTQSPFVSWLIDSTVLLPVYVLGVLVAFKLARRWVGPVLHTAKQVMLGSLVIALAGTVIGIAAAAANAAYDYNLQHNELVVSGPVHADHDTVIPGQAAAGHNHPTCDELCSQEHDTLVADVKAVGFGGPAILILNVLAVAWMVALIGGSLTRAGSGAAEPAATAAVPAQPAGQS